MNEMLEYTLHFIIGFIMYVMLFGLNMKPALALLIVIAVALSKEMYDHNIFKWHYLDCREVEHVFDFLMTIIPYGIVLKMFRKDTKKKIILDTNT